MANVGGRRPGAGRPKGAKSKVTAELKATLAQLCTPHVEGAIKTLAEIMNSTTSAEAARVAAATAILDRVYGKPKQDVGVDVSVSIVDALQAIAARRSAASMETTH